MKDKINKRTFLGGPQTESDPVDVMAILFSRNHPEKLEVIRSLMIQLDLVPARLLTPTLLKEFSAKYCMELEEEYNKMTPFDTDLTIRYLTAVYHRNRNKYKETPDLLKLF